MVAKNDSEMEITDNEFNELINNSHKIVVVDFFSEWCMPCLMIAPIIDELSEEMKEIKFTKINVDSNQRISRKYRVSNIPCLIIFKEGQEVGRVIGAQPIEEIREKIKNYI